MIKLNTSPNYKNCCASHDFCDANMVMEDALIACGMDDDELEDGWCGTDPVTWLWNKAWAIAKDNNFFLTEDDK